MYQFGTLETRYVRKYLIGMSSSWYDLSEDATHYVFGNRTSKRGADKDATYPTLVVLTATEDGWRARSTDRTYNHDYVCCETFRDVMAWLDLDLHRPFIASGRDEVLEVLTHSGSEHCLGFLYPGGVSSRNEEAEVVIAHLERGW